MSFNDWHVRPVPTSSRSTSRSEQESTFVCMATTVDELSYTPSEQEKSRDEAQFVDTGRRRWKTLKGKGEAVWPPILEAALLEALEKYQPEIVGSKADNVFGRFPMRNRFISDYIFELTGKRRSPKQVGSRLQQLRETCKSEKIVQLLLRDSHDPNSTSSQSDASLVSPSPPPENAPPSCVHTLVYVKILLQTELWPTPTPSIPFVNNDTSNPSWITLSPTPTPAGATYRSHSSSNILPYLSNSVTFPSPFTLCLQTNFSVYYNDNTLVHTETAVLRSFSSLNQSSGLSYGSDLVPNFWAKLCTAQDVTQFTIIQSLKPMGDLTENVGSISIVYQFAIQDTAGAKPQVTPTATSSMYLPPEQSNSASMASQVPKNPVWGGMNNVPYDMKFSASATTAHGMNATIMWNPSSSYMYNYPMQNIQQSMHQNMHQQNVPQNMHQQNIPQNMERNELQNNTMQNNYDQTSQFTSVQFPSYPNYEFPSNNQGQSQGGFSQHFGYSYP